MQGQPTLLWTDSQTVVFTEGLFTQHQSRPWVPARYSSPIHCAYSSAFEPAALLPGSPGYHYSPAADANTAHSDAPAPNPAATAYSDYSP